MGKEIQEKPLAELTNEELIALISTERNAREESEAEMFEVITELKSKLKNSENSSAAKKTVITVKKTRYSVTIPVFKFKGRIIRAAELENYPEVVEEILEDDSQTLLVEVVK